jgi:hypothetical protein
MAANMRTVFSSTVLEIGHDPDTNELHVRWRSGKHSVYSGVPAHLADSVSSAWSIGKAIHSQVKPFHEHRYDE